MATKKQTEPAAVEQAAPDVSAAEARNELGRALRVFRAFEHADKVLAVLENAEQVIAERQKMAAGALRMKEDAQSELDKALDDLAAAKQEAKDIRADAKLKAANSADEARAKAHEITHEAQQKLAALTADADAKAAELADLRKQLAAVQAELAEANGIIEKARAARAALAGV